MFLFAVSLQKSLTGPTARAIPSPEAAQHGPVDGGSTYLLLKLGPVKRILFTPPPPPSTRTPSIRRRQENTISWEVSPGPTRVEWEEMRRMGAALMEMFVIFAERFLVEPTTQAKCQRGRNLKT